MAQATSLSRLHAASPGWCMLFQGVTGYTTAPWAAPHWCLTCLSRSCEYATAKTIQMFNFTVVEQPVPMSMPVTVVELAGDAGPGARVSVGTAVSARARYYENRARNQIVTVSMPEVCPEEDRHCKVKRNVKLHITDRRTIWLSIDDVEWMVRYLFVQNPLKVLATFSRHLDDDEGLGSPLAVKDLATGGSASSRASDAD